MTIAKAKRKSGALLQFGSPHPMPPSSSRSTSAAADKTRVAARPRAKDRPAEAGSAAEKPFWKEKPLDALTAAEWESLCDGCGRCCLVKLEDEDSGEIHFTDIACKLFDAQTCRCSDYARRRRRVHDCIKLTPATVRSLSWLPPSCAYRLIAEGRDLAWWHPLVSGSASSVHEAGVSVQGRVAALETQVELKDYPDYIVTWPGKAPHPAKPKTRRAKCA